MCQLTLVNLNDVELNKLFLSTALQINSSVGNRDGTGFMVINEPKPKRLETVLWKTKESAESIEDLGIEIRNTVSTKYPIMAHVRAASRGIAVTNDNVHPFEGDRFYLAHNGTLYGKDEIISWAGNDDVGLESDSLTFLKSLEAEAKANKKTSIVELLNSVMGNYKGKFAFLIYDTFYDTHYVIRGSTADLHIANVLVVSGEEIECVGFVVNTKKNCLEDALMLFSQTAQIVTGKQYAFAKVEELDKNTIYEVNGITLVKVGELKENPVTYTAYTTYSPYAGMAGAGTGTHAGAVYVDNTVAIWKLSDRISRFMEDHFLSIVDIDALFHIFLGYGIADTDMDDFALFCSDIIPKISASKKLRSRMGTLLGVNGTIHVNMYSKVKGLEYPWMLNDSKMLDELCKAITELKKPVK